MNRIFRLVWNRELNALVVASELAGRGAGLHDGRRSRLMPAPCVLAMALLAALAGGRAHAQDSSQTLRDLQALAAKYTQPAPLKVDAEIALARIAAQQAEMPVLDVDASVRLQLAGPAAATPRRPARATPVTAAVDAAAGLRGHARIDVLLPRVPAGGSVQAGIGVAADAAVGVAARADAAIGVRTAPTPAGAAGASGPRLDVDAAAALALKDEEALLTTDTVIEAALDPGAAGHVGVQAHAHVLGAADRNLKLAGAAQADLQATSMGLGTVLGGVGDALGSIGGAVGDLLQGDLGGAVGGIGGAVGGVVGGALDGLGLSSPSPLPPGSPKAPVAGSPNSGLIVGNGGVVGTLSSLAGPTVQGLLGGDGYLRNGSLAVSTANMTQVFTSTDVLGVPVVNLSPAGSLLDGLGGVTTGGNSHLTLIGGVTSDSYIQNINTGDPNGVLGLLLPDQAPAWAGECLDVLGLATVNCWAVNAAQDYQVLVGDGAYANGSREVVIGANARHQLPLQDASEAFPGAGLNDPGDPTGVPTADYAARLGHSVVIGDSAEGFANGQVLLGAEATSDKANSVALGFRSSAARGAVAGYTAFGMDAAQTSAGEVSVGAVGAERQITHVAAGSTATDAVNVAQLQGALEQINAVGTMAVTYDDDGAGNPDYTRVTLGAGTGATTTIGNLAAGAVVAGSSEAVNGAQLAGTHAALTAYFGGTTAFDPATALFTAPQFAVTSVASDGSLLPAVYDNASDAFAAVEGSVVNLNTQISDIRNGAGSRFLKINSSGIDALASGAEGVALGAGAVASAAGSVALGAGSVADRAGSVSVGAAGAERQITHVAAATQATDAVNLSQLQAAEQGALRYDLAGDGSVDYTRATLGAGGAATTLRNVAAGAVGAASSEAVNGAQLFASNQALATHLGAGAAVDASGAVTAPTYTLNRVAADGSVTSGDYDNVGSAFDAVSTSLANVAIQADGVDRLAVKYDVDASGNASNTVTLVGDGSGGGVRLDNVAAGRVQAGSREAVNGSQLAASQEVVATYFGGTTMYDGNAWSGPTFRISSIATDGSVSANDYSNVTVAFSAVDSSLLSLNQRINTLSTGAASPFLAVNSLKAGATASGADAIALGPQASAAGAASVAVGDGASAAAGNSVALGAGSQASTGAQSGYTGAFGAAGASSSVGEVAVGSSGGERKVTHVADGSERYDAVNVGQLQNGVTYAIDQSRAYTDARITTLSDGTAGMFQVNNSQGLAQPAATGSNSAAGGAGASAAGADATAVGNGAQAQAANSVALGAGSIASRAGTVAVGSAGNERQIAHVADGSEATDAVNVRQLQASQQGSLRYDSRTDGSTDFSSVTLGQAGSAPTVVRNVGAGTAGTDAANVDQLRSGMAQTLDWSKAYTDERMSGFDRDLRETDNRASAGIASAMAVAALPQPSEAGRSMASLAAGSFNGESGVALGISGVSEGGRWIYKFSGSTNSRGDGGVAVGAGIQW